MAEENLGTTSQVAVWFSICLLFLRFQVAEKAKNIHKKKFSNTKSPARMNESDYVELCFVRWYELMDEKKPEVDKIYKVLSFVRLRWLRYPGKAGQLVAGKEFELIQVERIGELAQRMLHA